ncbi:MAG: hypothetical protein ACM3O3_04405 [Syntrophothermus sp.]
MIETKNLTCKDVMKHICDNLGEDIDSEKCKDFKEHLNSCNCCQNYFKSVEKVIEFYKEYNFNLPKDVHSRLMDCLGLDEK